MSELKGTWWTSLTGFQDGQPVSWMHRLKVRKVLGAAAVAWEEWLDCEVQAADCTAAKAGKQRGLNWSTPQRVLMVMDAKGVVYGVGATGSILLSSDAEGMTAVMLSNGTQDIGAVTSKAPPSAQSQTAPRVRNYKIISGSQYAVAGPLTYCCNDYPA